MYQVRVEKDSISPEGIRLTTMVIEFPRSVLAEVVTHRVMSDTWGEFECSWSERTTTKDISKNSASSRAIPLNKMIEKVETDPYMPTWTLNQKGMQGNTAEDDSIIARANNIWLTARHNAVNLAKELSELGIHKQDCNRLLEPWGWVTQVVTSSRWDNFFALRCHKAAHPAFRHVARMMYLAGRKSTPKPLKYGEWHLPLIKDEELQGFEWMPKYGKSYHPGWHETCEGVPHPIKFSAARCAWVSYNNADKEASNDAMINTWNRLFAEIPIHASPVEHQATPLPTQGYGRNVNGNYPKWHSNLPGWIQARKLLQFEEITNCEFSEQEIASWGME
jgi:thymidylate synthase ThyX